MQIFKKLDDHHRMIIPVEVRQALGAGKQDTLVFNINDNNEITLTKLENDSEVNLVHQKDEKSEDLIVSEPIEEVKTPEQPPSRLDDIVKTFSERPVEITDNDTKEKEEVKISITPKSSKPGRPRKIKILDTLNLPPYKSTDKIQVIELKPLEDNEMIELNVCPRCNKIVELGCNIKINGELICRDCVNDLKEQLKKDTRH